MKVAFIIVLFHTSEAEIDRLKREISQLGFSQYKIYWQDNSLHNRGYAWGVNQGIKRGLQDKAELFIILNPDISFNTLSRAAICAGAEYFDMWSFAMKQNGTLYYGEVIDKWRMSGGLVKMKPTKRFQKTDFVTGSLMVIKRSVFEQVGLFDESYFMYYEDVDYGYRCIKKGINIGIDTQYEYRHDEESDKNFEKKYWLAKNRFRFFLKYANALQILREFIRLPLTFWEERTLMANFFLKSSFLKNFFSLNFSSLLSKFINFILFFFLIRFLTVAEYGIYNLVWAHVGLLSPFVDFGTTSYGMVYLPKSKSDKTSFLFSLRLFLSFIVFILTILLAFLFHYENKIIIYIFLTSFVIFFNFASGTYLIVTSVMQKLTKTAVLSFILNCFIIFSIITGLLIFKKLRVIFIILALFYSVYSFYYSSLIKQLVPNLHIRFDFPKWYEIIKKSYIFVFISVFAGIYFKIDVLLLSFLKGKEAVGIYSSGYKFFEAIILIASSYNTVTIPLFSKIAQSNKSLLMKKVKRHGILLGLMGFSVVLMTYLLGPYIFPYILKGDYIRALPVVQIIVWALPVILFNSILLNIIYASDLSRYVVYLFAGLAAINIALNLLFIPYFSYFASSYITVFSEIISFTVLMYLVFIRFKKKIFYD